MAKNVIMYCRNECPIDGHYLALVLPSPLSNDKLKSPGLGSVIQGHQEGPKKICISCGGNAVQITHVGNMLHNLISLQFY